jgi:hypothetical protein
MNICGLQKMAEYGLKSVMRRGEPQKRGALGNPYNFFKEVFMADSLDLLPVVDFSPLRFSRYEALAQKLEKAGVSPNAVWNFIHDGVTTAGINFCEMVMFAIGQANIIFDNEEEELISTGKLSTGKL